MIAQGDIWWADLPTPTGSEPGFRRPLIVIQADAYLRSRLGTIVCAALTSQEKWSAIPGNVWLDARTSGLERDSVVVASQIITVDRAQLYERVGRVSGRKLEQVLSGVCAMMGR